MFRSLMISRSALCAVAVLSVVATSALAQKLLGTYQAWTAATHQEASGTVCYAFTQLSASRRPDSLLSVMHRPQGRDQVALRIGRRLPRRGEVTVTVGPTNLNFYVADGIAFARSGRAAVSAFRGGQSAVIKTTPRNSRHAISDTFSLAGFSAAYAAVGRACPPSPPRRLGSRRGGQGT